MEGLDINDGLTALAVLGLAGLLGTMLFTQLDGWAPVWNAWLVADAGLGYAESSPKTEFFSQLPVVIFIYWMLAVIALASPRALTVGNG